MNTVIPLMWASKSSQIQENGKVDDGLQGLREGKWGVVYLMGKNFSFTRQKKNSQSWLHSNVNVLNTKLST